MGTIIPSDNKIQSSSNWGRYPKNKVLSNSTPPSDTKKESSSTITNSNSNSNLNQNNNNNDTTIGNDTPKRTMNRFFINNPYRKNNSTTTKTPTFNTNSKGKDEVTKDVTN